MTTKAKFWLLTVLGAAGLGAAALWAKAVTSAPEAAVARARRDAIRAVVDERGMTRLPQTYLIAMPYAGRIEPIALREGDAVKQNDALEPVARVVREDLRLAVEEARAAVERLDNEIAENRNSLLEGLAHKQAEQFKFSMGETVKAAAERVKAGAKRDEVATSRLARVEDLWKAKAASDDELDQARLEEVQAEVDFRQDELVLSAMRALGAAAALLPEMVRQYVADKDLKEAVLQKSRAEASARLEKALLDQKRGALTSPVDGVVLKRFVTDVSGERFLQAGEPLVEIGRLEDLEVEADVLSLDVVEAAAGNRVEIYGPAVGRNVRAAGRDYALGAVANIYPAGFTKVSSLGVEQQRVKVIVRIDPEDLSWLRRQRNLGVGYRVRVRIVTQEKPDALVVPRSALFRGDAGQWQLNVVREGRVQVQAVRVGILNDRHAEVLEGLEEGDLVAVAPESALAPGARVRPVPVEGPPGHDALGNGG